MIHFITRALGVTNFKYFLKETFIVGETKLQLKFLPLDVHTTNAIFNTLLKTVIKYLIILIFTKKKLFLLINDTNRFLNNWLFFVYFHYTVCRTKNNYIFICNDFSNVSNYFFDNFPFLFILVLSRFGKTNPNISQRWIYIARTWYTDLSQIDFGTSYLLYFLWSTIIDKLRLLKLSWIKYRVHGINLRLGR